MMMRRRRRRTMTAVDSPSKHGHDNTVAEKPQCICSDFMWGEHGSSYCPTAQATTKQTMIKLFETTPHHYSTNNLNNNSHTSQQHHCHWSNSTLLTDNDSGNASATNQVRRHIEIGRCIGSECFPVVSAHDQGGDVG